MLKSELEKAARESASKYIWSNNEVKLIHVQAFKAGAKWALEWVGTRDKLRFIDLVIEEDEKEK